mmetsp:Transcript_22816/g.53303  ORF Transcript_22816/g.53303 Transcript_22816/m.53303 type:complete len:450 (+) Transcript_22816:67-1416(+)
MPIIFITVKLPDGGLVHLDVDNKTRVEEFRTIIAPKVGIKRHRQRLVFAGKLLQDGRTLEAYGIERNSTIHLLHGPSAEADSPGGVDIIQIPKELAVLQRHVLNNPDILQQMLESPAMQNLLNDHELLRSLLKMDPRLSKLLDGSPDLREMLDDKDFMNQASDALRNPVHVRDILRSSDRAMAHLEEKLPQGGFEVYAEMCSDINRPLQDPEYAKQCEASAKLSSPKNTKPAERTRSQGVAATVDEQEGDEEGSEEKLAESTVKPAPAWVGSFDTNAMASMMQDHNMQQLLSQLAQTIGGPTVKPHPDDPFLDSGFLGQLFNSQTVSSMMQMQAAVEKLSLAAEPGEKPNIVKTRRMGKGAQQEKQEEFAQDSPAVLSGLNPRSPACNFKDTFALFLQAEQESPEVRYKSQLQAMANMGFTDTEACIAALHGCDGNMNKAVETLMQNKK